jgi:hypothetical protein
MEIYDYRYFDTYYTTFVSKQNFVCLFCLTAKQNKFIEINKLNQ